jgi:ParB family transcriptional regulator, chromosome partitioning protein
MDKQKAQSAPLQEIYPIRLDQIEIGDENVRHADPLRDLDQLAASIRKQGLLQPVVLRGTYGTPPYELISGQRRFLAHHNILKRNTIRAVFAGPLSKTDCIVRSLVENLQRLDLDYEDTARAVTYLYENFNKNDRRVHQETGLSLRRVRDFILIEARSTPRMKLLLKQRKVTPVDVKRAIRAAQDNLGKAEELVELIVKYKPTSYQKRRLVLYGEQDKNASASRILDDAMKPHVEQNIIISLPADLLEALNKATKKLALEPEELAAKVLADWLRTQGFSA